MAARLAPADRDDALLAVRRRMDAVLRDAVADIVKVFEGRETVSRRAQETDTESALPMRLDAARTAALAAGERTLPLFLRTPAQRKADGTLVTEADRASERCLRNRLAAAFPHDAFLGEEMGRSGPPDARWTWVVDPLDGTAGFVLGVPLFGVLVGLLDRGEPVVGVMRFPVLGETVYAARGSGCWFGRDGEEPSVARVTRVASLGDSTVSTCGLGGTDLVGSGDGPGWRFSEVIRRAGTVRFVPDAYQHALVCRGLLHAALDPSLAPWDIAALVPCVEEAGGTTTAVDGCRDRVVEGGSLLSTCGGPLHVELIEALRPAG